MSLRHVDYISFDLSAVFQLHSSTKKMRLGTRQLSSRTGGCRSLAPGATPVGQSRRHAISSSYVVGTAARLPRSAAASSQVLITEAPPSAADPGDSEPSTSGDGDRSHETDYVVIGSGIGGKCAVALIMRVHLMRQPSIKRHWLALFPEALI